MRFRRDPLQLLNGILSDIAKIERFTEGVEYTLFEQDDQFTYAVKYALLRISEAARSRSGENPPQHVVPEM